MSSSSNSGGAGGGGGGGEREKKRREDAPPALLLGGKELPTELLLHALSYLSAWRLYGLAGVNRSMRALLPEIPKGSYLTWHFNSNEAENDKQMLTEIEAQDRFAVQGHLGAWGTGDAWRRSARFMDGPFSVIDMHSGYNTDFAELLAMESLQCLRVLRVGDALHDLPEADLLALSIHTRSALGTPATTDLTKPNMSASAFINEVAMAYPNLREFKLSAPIYTMPNLSPLSRLPLRYLEIVPYDDFAGPGSASADEIKQDDIAVAKATEKKASLPLLQCLGVSFELLPLVVAPRLTHLRLPNAMYRPEDHPGALVSRGLTIAHTANLHLRHPELQCLIIKRERTYGDLDMDHYAAEHLPRTPGTVVKHMRHVHIDCPVVPGFLKECDFPALETARLQVEDIDQLLDVSTLQPLARSLRNARIVEMDASQRLHIDVPDGDPASDPIPVAWEELSIPFCRNLVKRFARLVTMEGKRVKVSMHGKDCCYWTTYAAERGHMPLDHAKRVKVVEREVQRLFGRPDLETSPTSPRGQSGAELAWNEAAADARRAIQRQGELDRGGRH